MRLFWSRGAEKCLVLAPVLRPGVPESLGSEKLSRNGQICGRHISAKVAPILLPGAGPVHLVEEHLDEFIRQRSRVRVSSEDIFEVYYLPMH